MDSSEAMMSQSPASVQVRWQYDNMMMMMRGNKKNAIDFNEGDSDSDNDAESDAEKLSEAWNVPSAAEMKRRLSFRRSIREETLQHRRIHRHGGIIDGRNIVQILMEREAFGSRSLKHNRNYTLPLNILQNEVKGKAISSGNVNATATATVNAITNMNANDNATTRQTANANRNTTEKVPFPGNLTNEIRMFSEYSSVVRYHSAFCKHLGGDDQRETNGQRPSSSKAVSTISIAFSPDSFSMASTHGDHTVKITSCASGHLLQTLEGHPRTPWTVKYHPKDSSLLASGCLGHQVRIWNWKTAACLHMIRLEFAIISLSFHPTGKVLAIANGTRLHFWALDGKLRLSEDDADMNNSTSQEASTRSQDMEHSSIASQPLAQQRRGLLTEVEQRHMLRCVHFPPNGNKVIVGGVNPTTDANRPRRGGISGGGMSFYLRLWDFDLQAALRPGETNMGLRRRAISNPRTFLPRALLYNDGGFDVSPDGKTLCACAEYWLPDGVDNAMDLLYASNKDDLSDDEMMDGNEGNSRHLSQEPNARGIISSRQESEDVAEFLSQSNINASPPRQLPSTLNQTPMASSGRSNPMTPQTPPPAAIREGLTLSPPSPPGRRFAGGLGRPSGSTMNGQEIVSHSRGMYATNQSIPPPPPPNNYRRPPNPFSTLNKNLEVNSSNGRYVPHVVTVSLDTAPIDAEMASARNEQNSNKLSEYLNSKWNPNKARPRLGDLLEACPLDGTKASAVTCVKFSPSTNFCLIGYGVREPVVEHNGNHYHPVTALYRVRGGMTHVSTMLSGDDDVNIARFHPEPGYGFVYGTKQGRVRILSPRPWNFYNC